MSPRDPSPHAGPLGRVLPASSQPSAREGFELAQDEYDHATELIRLLAPEATAGLALNQREAFSRLAAAAIRGTYDDGRARTVIAEVSGPLLTAMRHDLDGSGEP